MKTYEQLMTHYWGKIAPMAEAAGIKPWECVRYCDMPLDHHAIFNGTHDRYTFALTVLDGKPVFNDSEIYSKHSGNKFIAGEVFVKDLKDEFFTWTPPTKKRTFMLGDKELPCPSVITDHTLHVDEVVFSFKTEEDRYKVKCEIVNLLTEARDKE